MLATISDVEDRLGTEITVDEHRRVEGLIDEASVLVEAYLGRAAPDPTPGAVRIVVSRMVARVLQAPEPSFSVDSYSHSAGPFSQTQKFTTGASGGAPWLTAADKTALGPFRRRRRGFYSISMV